MTNIENIADRGAAYGIPGVIVDGNNIIEVVESTTKAVERARSGKGPTLIEAKTYRWEGHSRSDARKYRTRDEEKEWKKQRDPISLFKERLIAENVLTEEEFNELDKKVQTQMDEAIEFAENSQDPSLETLTTDIYA